MEQALDIRAHTNQLSEIGLSTLAEPPYIDLGTELIAQTEPTPPDTPPGNRPNRATAPSFGQTRQAHPHAKSTAVQESNIEDSKQGFGWENAHNSSQDERQADQIPPPGYLPKSPTNSAQSFQAYENAPLKPAPPAFRDIGQGVFDHPNTPPRNASPIQTTTNQSHATQDRGENASNQPNGGTPMTPWATYLPNLALESEKSTATDDLTKAQISPNQTPNGTTIPRTPFQALESLGETIGDNWVEAPQATGFSTIKGLAAFAEQFVTPTPPVSTPLTNNNPQSAEPPPAVLPPQEQTLDPEAILELIEQRIESAFRRFYG